MEWEKILIAVITAVVPVLAGFLSTWLKSLYDNNKTKIKNEKAQVTLGLVNDMIIAAVETTTSTYVKELKKAGTFDAEAQKEAFNKTWVAVQAQLTTDAKTVIQDVYGNVEAFLTNKIEQTVEELKK